MTDYIKLAHRAVNCRKWRWVDGMIAVSGYVTLDKRLPDLTHPATMGCLLALVREAHRDPRMFVEAYSFLRDTWRCVGVSFSSEWVGPNEAETLVAALEAANGR
jgi:hypothetical protein